MSASNDPPITHVGRDTALLLAPQCVAWQLSFFLFGIYLALLFKTVRDPVFSQFARPVKIVNWLVFGLVLVYNLLAFYNNLHWMIELKRTPPEILLGWPIDFLFPTSAGLVGLVCQVFLTFRASVLIRNDHTRIAFQAVVITLALLSFSASMSVTILGFILYNNGSSSFSYNNAVSLWLITSAVVDVAISAALTITLRQRVGLVKEVDSLLRRLILVGLHSAAYTAIPAVTGAVVSIVYRDINSYYSLLHFAFWMPLPCCYGISIYTTIATRKMIDNHIANSFAFPPTSTQLLNQHVFDGGEAGTGVTTQSNSKRKHPLAEIAPWAAHLYKRRMSRVAPNPAPTSAFGSPTPTMEMRSVLASESPRGGLGGRRGSGMEDWAHLTEKQQPSRDNDVAREHVVRKPSQKQTARQLSIEQRRSIAAQLRERAKEQEEAQTKEDNMRAIWW